MQLERYIERIKFIHRLIHRRATGKPEELGRKLGISKRMVYEYLKELKDHGAPIAFSKQQNSYFYSREWDIENYFKEPAQSVCVIFSGIRCDELIEEFDIMNHLNYVKDSLNQMTRQGLASIYPVTFFIQNNTIAFSKQQNSYFYSREWDIENYFKEIFRVQ